jgi:hypothetical protein
MGNCRGGEGQSVLVSGSLLHYSDLLLKLLTEV